MYRFLLVVLMVAGGLCASPVRVSTFKPVPGNGGAALQKAIDSGASEIIVDDPGFELLAHAPIKLRSDLKIFFDDGVVLAAAPGKFKSTGSSLFSGKDIRNLEMTGKGKVILKMRKKDYQDPKRYAPSEWRHIFSFKGSENVKLKNLTLLSSGGDGIYLGCGKKNHCKNFLLEELKIEAQHRQAISIISAENITIRRCTLKDTAGTAPGAGIDFEPNHKPADLRLVNILVDDCIISGNAGNGLELYTAYIEGKCRPLSITFRNCRISGNENGTTLRTSWHRKGERAKVRPPRGYINYKNCIFEKNRSSEILINDQYGVKVSFENCILRPDPDAKAAPIIFCFKAMQGAPVSNVDFGNLIVENFPVDRQLIGFKSWGDAELADITGSITMVNNKKRTSYDLPGRIAEINKIVTERRKIKFTPAVTDWKTVIPGSGKPGNSSICVRNAFALILASPAGSRGKLKAQVLRPGKTRGVTLISPSGKKIAHSPIGRKHLNGKLDFTFPAEGVVHAGAIIGGGVINFSSTVPWGICAYGGKSLAFMGPAAKLRFTMNASRAVIRLCGSNTSPISVTIRDEKGSVKFRQDVEEPVYVRLATSTPGKVWSLEYKTKFPKQTLLVWPGAGLDGIFAPADGEPPRLRTTPAKR